MIIELTIDKIIPRFLNLIPDFNLTWNEYLTTEEDRDVFLDVVVMARYIVVLYKVEKEKDLKIAFDFIEECLTSGDDEVKELISTGLLENIQMLMLQKIGHNIIEKYMKEKTILCWKEINSYWGHHN